MFSCFYATKALRCSFLFCSIFPFAIPSCTKNPIVMNISIFSFPLIVCFSNPKSLSILPFSLSTDVLFLYSRIHFLLSLAIGVNTLLSSDSFILNISFPPFCGGNLYLKLSVLLSYPA